MVTAKCVAQSASRALGLVIAKANAFGGFPFWTFSKLYDATVSSVISYGAAIWGTRDYSCVSAVQHRACRFFWGVGKFTPNAAVVGDMGLVATGSTATELCFKAVVSFTKHGQ